MSGLDAKIEHAADNDVELKGEPRSTLQFLSVIPTKASFMLKCDVMVTVLEYSLTKQEMRAFRDNIDAFLQCDGVAQHCTLPLIREGDLILSTMGNVFFQMQEKGSIFTLMLPRKCCIKAFQQFMDWYDQFIG